MKRHVIITRDRSEGRREEVGHERRSIVNEAKLGYTPGTVTRGTSLKRVSSDQFDTNGTSLSRVDKDKRGKGEKWGGGTEQEGITGGKIKGKLGRALTMPRMHASIEEEESGNKKNNERVGEQISTGI